jgi:predicted nucleic acid-binding protein
METYLLDTSALSPLIDGLHSNHAKAKALISSIATSPIYVSSVALAELMFGFEIHEKARSKKLQNAEQMLLDAQSYPTLEIGKHTAPEYASIKAKVAAYYLPNVTKQFRSKWVEEWINKFTGLELGIQEGDLWVCAQACEKNYTLVADDKMVRITTAEPKLKLLPIK